MWTTRGADTALLGEFYPRQSPNTEGADTNYKRLRAPWKQYVYCPFRGMLSIFSFVFRREKGGHHLEKQQGVMPCVQQKLWRVRSKRLLSLDQNVFFGPQDGLD